ncbi:MAG: DUF881 domain-containing protein [Actinobacteria bacterium]|nr:DUF881 domain-containing protein [Actinomycetota bacterium]
MSVRVVVTTVIAALAGFLFVASGLTAQGTNLRTGGVEDLRGLVIDRASTVAVLSNRLSVAAREVDKLSAQKVDPALTAQINALENSVGLKDLTGSALEVVLNDAPRTPGTALPEGVGPDDLVVHQQDVQAVVNAMWRGGATGVSVMDQRIVSTSAIRCVGNTLLLQGRVYSPPFKVIAIGNVTQLQRALNDEPAVVAYRQYVDKLGLGWKVTISQETTLPGWQGSIQ